MSIANFEEAMNIISALADKPNETNGLDADQMKAKFDRAGTLIKEYINNTMVPAINKAQENIGDLITDKYGKSDVVPVTSGGTGEKTVGGVHSAFGIVRENLLDNWYFANPINQRGQTTYDQERQYTIDRWMKGGATGSEVTLEENNLSLTNNGETAVLYFYQRFEEPLMAGTYTLSVKVNGMSYGDSIPYVYISDNEGNSLGRVNITDIGIFSKAISVEANKAYRVQFAVPAGVQMEVESVKLEMGPVSTLEYSPRPNKAIELAKCQRHQLSVFSGGGARLAGFGLANSATAATILVSLPVTLRATPTVTFSDMYLRNYALGLAAEVTAITAYVNGSNCAWLQVTSSGLTAGEPVFLRTESGSLFLDANL